MKKHQKVRREDDALVIQKRNSSRRNSPRWRKALAWAVTAWTLGMTPVVYAMTADGLPLLDAKDAAVSVITRGDTMTITGAENNLIKWVDFSIANGKTVNFNDTNNYLNYITGSARSDILGTLAGGGHIYIVNPNGILIGDNATVNVGSLHLSTRTLTDAQMNAFSTNGTNPLTSGAIGGDVINMGRLNANSITVEGNNITFKNVADVTKDGDLVKKGNGYDISGGKVHDSDAVMLTAGADGEIHIGSANASTPAYSMNGTDKKYMYKLVSTPAELQNMNNNRSASYMLANDVDMKDFGNFTPIAPGDGDGYFTGRFDGLNHQIQNLTVNSGADNVGLFGYVYTTGVVENVGLVSGSVTGTGTLSYVGGIVGRNDGGTIRNVYHTGTVTGTRYVGGIVGFNDYESEQIGVEMGADGKLKPIYGDTYLGTVECAYNTGSVTGTGNASYVGGIAGHSKGVIREVFNTGAVSSAGSTSEVGGIVGTMHTLGASVENAYNTGAITGAFYVGGIAGSSQGKLTNVYNTGTVTGTSTSTNMKVGSLVGNEDGFLTNAYSISGVASALTGTDLTANDTNVAELSAEEMKTPAKFVGFGFTTGTSANGKWRIYEGQTTPLLTAFLTRADNKISETEYNGTATGDVGATYTAATTPTTFSAENAQFGCNYIQNVTRVTPKALKVSFGSTSKTYDGTTDATAGAATLEALVGDIVEADKGKVSVVATAAYNDKNVRETKTVNYSGIMLTGDKAKNYNLINTTYDGTGSITAKELTVSFADISKTYDGTTNATAGAGTLAGYIEADKDNLGVKASAEYDSKNVGDRTVNYTNVYLTGMEKGNYFIANNATGTGTITRKALSLVATPQTVTEGEATLTSWSGSVTGFVAGDGLTDTDALFFALDNPAAAAVGKYSITGTLNGATSGDYGDNYTFANAASNATAFTIQAKKLTPQDIIGEATNDQNAAREYMDTVAMLNGGSNTILAMSPKMSTKSVLPKGNDLPTGNAQPAESNLPTGSVQPTESDLPTGNAQPTENNLPTGNNLSMSNPQPAESNLPTGNPQPKEAAQENNVASGEQNGAQEQNGLLPTQQTDNGQIAAGKQETQLGITYTDINMPESMSVEALATSLNGGATQQGNAEAATNGPATEPTATTGGNMSGVNEEDEA